VNNLFLQKTDSWIGYMYSSLFSIIAICCMVSYAGLLDMHTDGLHYDKGIRDLSRVFGVGGLMASLALAVGWSASTTWGRVVRLVALILTIAWFGLSVSLVIIGGMVDA
jgi:hypothetical protein